MFPFPLGKSRPDASIKDELWWEGGNAPHVAGPPLAWGRVVLMATVGTLQQAGNISTRGIQGRGPRGPGQGEYGKRRAGENVSHPFRYPPAIAARLISLDPLQMEEKD